MNFILLIGAILGFLSVVMGAYIDHALKMNIDDKTMNMVLTAIRYHQLYAVIIIAIGLCLLAPLNRTLSKRLIWTACVFSIGVLLFSFSIYLTAITGISDLTKITPIGGMTFMLGWGMLVWISLRKAN